MRKTDLALLITTMLCAANVQADPLTEAASDVTECREMANPDARLACYDAAAAPLARALGSAERPASASAAPAVESPDPGRSPPSHSAPASSSEKRTAKQSPASDPSAVDGEAEIPAWATAPHDEESRGEQPDEFTATIVRIVRNNIGRHYFYTDDGAVWMQTQVESIRPPESLPAKGEFRRRLTGNPTIKFDISNRSYRVRRIE